MLKSLPLILSLVPTLQPFSDFSLSQYFISYITDNNNSFNNLETIIAQRKLPTFEKDGFVFQYTGCERLSSDSIKCNFVVNNKQRTRPLEIVREETRIIDSAGNEFIALQVNLGTKKDNSVGILNDKVVRFAINQIPTKAPMNGSAIFRGDIANKIVLFDIYTGDSHIEFRPI
ncbi:MAG: hypothetical protein V7K68_31795 [Nostoc sp.]|uniref:hypothetical protein n=1 Tax=Nostoc sp. TaxID=1180 RepID=UPI002FF988DF